MGGSEVVVVVAMQETATDPISAALARGGTIDITTTGRRTGRPHRIEIWFHNLDGELYITGRPGRTRDWLANLRVAPDFVFHLKRGVQADLPARAEEITDPQEREKILRRIMIESWNNPISKVDHIIDRWVAGAPLIRVEVTPTG